MGGVRRGKGASETTYLLLGAACLAGQLCCLEEGLQDTSTALTSILTREGDSGPGFALLQKW